MFRDKSATHNTADVSLAKTLLKQRQLVAGVSRLVEF